MTTNTIAVIGAGTMGNGIAHVFARAGYSVHLADVSPAALEAAVGTIRKNLAREVAKAKLTAEDADAAIARITTSVGLDSIGQVDLAIEAASERIEVKSQVFTRLDTILPPDAILASNTSSISITRSR
jgi:3-hydroxybutyryl-CoA dehydrogenase